MTQPTKGKIECRAISKPTMQFTCEVVRGTSSMRYQDGADGKFKPVQPERLENWIVLAETIEAAKRVAEYHFFASKIITVKQNN